MARLFTTGFELNSTAASVEFITTSSVSISGATVRSGARALSAAPGAATQPRMRQQYFSSADLGPFWFRTYFRAATFPSGENRILALSTSTTVGIGVIVYLTIDNTGAIKLYDEDGQIAGTTTLSTGTWYQIEVMYNATGVAGSHTVELRVDGVVIATSNTRSLSTGANQFYIGGNLNTEGHSTGSFFYDDVGINDSTDPASGQNSWLGSGKVIYLKPNAAGDNTQWTIGAGSGSNYEVVDEATPNDGTDFIQSRTTGEIDDYNLENSGIGATDVIRVLHVFMRGNRSSTGTVSSAMVARLKAAASGTVEEGVAETASTTLWRSNDLDATTVIPYALTSYYKPGTTDRWTQADLDTAQIGVRCSTGSGDRYVQLTSIGLMVEYFPVTGSANTKELTETVAIREPYGNGYVRHLKLTIDPAKVAGSSNLTDFPALITEAVLPDDFWSRVNSSGNDIRISTDADGLTEVPFEIVSINTTTKKAEIWAKIPSVSHNTDTVFYLFYGRAGQAAYAASDPFGSQNVWTGYAAVWHMEGNSNDSTANANTGSDAAMSYTTSDAIAGSKAAFNGTSSRIAPANSASLRSAGNFTVQSYMKTATVSRAIYNNLQGGLGPTQGILLDLDGSGHLRFFSGDTGGGATATGATVITDNTARWVAARYTGAAVQVVLNGVQDATAAYANSPNWYAPDMNVRIGCANLLGSDNNFFLGSQDEVRIANDDLSDDWMVTEKEMFTNLATFYSAVVVETAFSAVQTHGRILTETVTVTDSIVRSVNRTLSETVAVVDTITTQRSLFRTFSEVITIADTVLRTFGRVLSEVVQITGFMVQDEQNTKDARTLFSRKTLGKMIWSKKTVSRTSWTEASKNDPAEHKE